MHSNVTTASTTKFGTDTNQIRFTLFHKWKRKNVDREIVESIGDGDFDPYTVDDGKYTVIGITDSGDLVLVADSNGSVSVFTDIDLIQSDVSETVAEFLEILVIEPCE